MSLVTEQERHDLLFRHLRKHSLLIKEWDVVWFSNHPRTYMYGYEDGIGLREYRVLTPIEAERYTREHLRDHLIQIPIEILVKHSLGDRTKTHETLDVAKDAYRRANLYTMSAMGEMANIFIEDMVNVSRVIEDEIDRGQLHLYLSDNQIEPIKTVFYNDFIRTPILIFPQ